MEICSAPCLTVLQLVPSRSLGVKSHHVNWPFLLQNLVAETNFGSRDRTNLNKFYSVQRLNCGLNSVFFCFSWVKKNVKETYGGDEEVRDRIVIHFSFLVVINL